MKENLIFVLGLAPQILIINPLIKREGKMSGGNFAWLMTLFLLYTAIPVSFFPFETKQQINIFICGAGAGLVANLCLTSINVWNYIIPAFKNHIIPAIFLVARATFVFLKDYAIPTIMRTLKFMLTIIRDYAIPASLKTLALIKNKLSANRTKP